MRIKFLINYNKKWFYFSYFYGKDCKESFDYCWKEQMFYFYNPSIYYIKVFESTNFLEKQCYFICG